MFSKSIPRPICENKRICNSINNFKVRWAGWSFQQHDIFHDGGGIGLRKGRADYCGLGHRVNAGFILCCNWILHGSAVAIRFVNHRLKNQRVTGIDIVGSSNCKWLTSLQRWFFTWLPSIPLIAVLAWPTPIHATFAHVRRAQKIPIKMFGSIIL